MKKLKLISALIAATAIGYVSAQVVVLTGTFTRQWELADAQFVINPATHAIIEARFTGVRLDLDTNGNVLQTTGSKVLSLSGTNLDQALSDAGLPNAATVYDKLNKLATNAYANGQFN